MSVFLQLFTGIEENEAGFHTWGDFCFPIFLFWQRTGSTPSSNVSEHSTSEMAKTSQAKNQKEKLGTLGRVPEIYTNIYHLPGTQMTLVLIGKGLVLGWVTFKNRGHLGSRYIIPIYGFYNGCIGQHGVMFDCYGTFPRVRNISLWKKQGYILYASVSVWWLNQPIWKIWVKLDHFPRVRGENKRIFETTT